MCNKEYCRFEQQLAFHTAPSLLGIKCASLMSVKKDASDIHSNTAEFNRRTAARDIKLRCLCDCEKRALLLLYNEEKLARRLNDPHCRRVLRECGYTDDMNTDDCLERLASRIRGEKSFPHEIGIFLDYPVEDVVGFIENNGYNYKLSGYWKVYGDPVKAQRTFDNYNKCRRFLCNKLSAGEDLCCALKIS
ncbi:MAG: DUF3793 family protein [Ruminococcaceae bacterium]|nr:DUF3793 family protein [Oscillospiraceae bacterium]